MRVRRNDLCGERASRQDEEFNRFYFLCPASELRCITSRVLPNYILPYRGQVKLYAIPFYLPMPLASLGGREAGQPFPMLRTHNYTHYAASSSNPRRNPRHGSSQADKLDSDDVSTDALIPSSESTREPTRTRRVYSGIHSAANMRDEVTKPEKVGKPMKERRVSHGRGGIGNMRACPSGSPESICCRRSGGSGPVSCYILVQ